MFGSRRTFVHYRTNFVFEPERELSHPTLIFGWLGREKVISERTSPSDGFRPTEHLGWQAAFVIIDPTEHLDGQKIAVEDDPDIGRPRAILNSLIQQFNRDPETSYFVYVFPILSVGTFWTFAEQHREMIASITFDVAVPNMFSGVEDFQKELRALRDGENVSTVTTTLASDTALQHKTERIKEIVDYVENGGGDLSARATDGATYNTQQHEKKVQIEVEPHTRDVKKFLREIIFALDRIF